MIITGSCPQPPIVFVLAFGEVDAAATKAEVTSLYLLPVLDLDGVRITSSLVVTVKGIANRACYLYTPKAH
jgi:hypothetical protein